MLNLNEKEKKALKFFNENLGAAISLQEIVDVTGWEKSTVITYYNKCWKDKVLKVISNNLYEVILSVAMSESVFKDLQTQVK